MVFLCSGSNIWDNRMSFCSVLLESTVIKFLLVNKEIKVFPGKVTLKERSWIRRSKYFCSYSKMNILLFFCAVTFRVDCEMYSFCRKWKVPFFWKKMNSLKFIQDKHYELSVEFDKKNVRCFFLVVYFSYRPWYVFAFLMAGMTGAGWCYRSGTLSTSRLIVR